MSSFQRAHGRAHDSLRPVSIEVGPMKYAEGSALIEMGDTRVLVAASIESRVPPFLI
ncbi:MAG: ribonuclease PH, partial [Thermoanaerobaculia bacterium]